MCVCVCGGWWLAEGRGVASGAWPGCKEGMGLMLRPHAPHLVIHLMAQSAFFLTAGTRSIAWNRRSFSAGSLMYDSSSRLYISGVGKGGQGRGAASGGKGTHRHCGVSWV